MASEKRETLGTDVVPLHYEILIEASLKSFSFIGRERITVDLKSPQKQIRLNSQNLKIASAKIEAGGMSYDAAVSHDDKTETVTLRTAKAVSGQLKLHIEFTGEISENAGRGLYKSRYRNGANEGYILTTQFEPSDARCAFPCFDEPAMKATFDLSFIVDSSLKVISNMDVRLEDELGGGRKLVVFNTTPKMSTYLVYFGMGPFEAAEGKLGDLPVRIITTPGMSDKAELALGYAKTFLKFYEDYFYMKYPMPKLELIAIPDFSAAVSAMENWGAITFRQDELLGRKSELSFTLRRRIATIVAHELAHQWFGDLVTMAWWNDLWLNESFATFMEKKTLDELYPEFKRGIETITSDTASAFSQDALLSTHPINVTINTPAEAGAIFDEISYAKGLAVLSMIEDYATAETFRMGLHKYFKKHLYSNADQNDLWNALREVGKGAARDLPTVSRFWVNNPGYPIVSVSRKGKREIKLEQSRFTYLPFNGKQKPWPIPIRYFDGKNEGFLLMKGRTATIKTTGSFIKLNHGQKGFYRVMYDEASLKSLGKMISSRKLSDVDAYGVISDLFARARACRIKVEDVLDFIEGYCMECGYPSNAAISSYLSGLQLRFQGKRGISARARALAIRVNRSMLKRVGWVPKADEQSEVTLQRSSAIRNSGICGDKSVTSKCISLFDSHVAKRSILHVDIRTSVYLALAFGGDAKLFQRFVNMYKLQDSGEETMRLGAAIGSFNNASLAAKALEFAMSRYVRAQDKNSIAAYVSSTPDGKGVFWRWFEENWKAIREIYKGDVAGLGRFVEDLDDTDTTAAMERIKLFFKRKENHPEEIAKSLRDTLEAIETNIRFLEHNS